MTDFEMAEAERFAQALEAIEALAEPDLDPREDPTLFSLAALAAEIHDAEQAATNSAGFKSYCERSRTYVLNRLGAGRVTEQVDGQARRAMTASRSSSSAGTCSLPSSVRRRRRCWCSPSSPCSRTPSPQAERRRRPAGRARRGACRPVQVDGARPAPRRWTSGRYGPEGHPGSDRAEPRPYIDGSHLQDTKDEIRRLTTADDPTGIDDCPFPTDADRADGAAPRGPRSGRLPARRRSTPRG